MEDKTKKCSKCLDTYSLSFFSKNKQSTDGLSYWCKKCINSKVAEKKLKMKDLDIQCPSTKYCPRCEIIKSSSYFAKSKVSMDGLFSYCKECRTTYDTNKRKSVKEKVIVDSSIIKICQSCKLSKQLTEFRVNRKCVDNFNDMCYTCDPKTNWTRDKKHISEKKYRMNNPDKMKEKYKNQSKLINRRIRSSLNSRLKSALLNSTNKKTNSIVNYIGCTITFFKDWIENLFQDNMTWDNYGEWHLDHVKPCASFDLSDSEQIKICFNWKNYQPLWGIDNLIKNDTVDKELIQKHLEKATNYEKSINNIISAQVKEGGLLEQL
jgi:hypothetical protein